ncbi:MAG: PAS domain-containing protein [Desulfovermiculus sp.]
MERDAPPVKHDPEPRLDYQEIFQYLPEGVFTIDTLWRITSFNKTAEGITGYNRHISGLAG